MKLLKETGEMGQRDIEKDGEFYENAQMLKSAAQHIQKLTKGMLKFKTIRPFDKYRGPYAQCELLGRWARLWEIQEDSIEPEYFLETFYRSADPENDIAGDVYQIAKLIKKQAKEKYGLGEDILKYGTKEEIKFLLETWRGKLQGEYNDFEEFKQYDEIYGLSERLGFDSSEEAWEANPLIQGGVNPKDYKVINDFHRVKVCARCGKKLKRGETGGVCDMCAEDIDMGRDRE